MNIHPHDLVLSPKSRCYPSRRWRRIVGTDCIETFVIEAAVRTWWVQWCIIWQEAKNLLEDVRNEGRTNSEIGCHS